MKEQLEDGRWDELSAVATGTAAAGADAGRIHYALAQAVRSASDIADAAGGPWPLRAHLLHVPVSVIDLVEITPPAGQQVLIYGLRLFMREGPGRPPIRALVRRADTAMRDAQVLDQLVVQLIDPGMLDRTWAAIAGEEVDRRGGEGA